MLRVFPLRIVVITAHILALHQDCVNIGLAVNIGHLIPEFRSIYFIDESISINLAMDDGTILQILNVAVFI